MRFKEIMKKVTGIILASALMVSSIGVIPVMAAEPVEGEPAQEGAADPAADPAAADPAAVDPAAVDPAAVDPAAVDPAAVDPAQAGGVTAGTIVANNGLYIANDFPDTYLPTGFSKMVVAYQGQNIALASMDNSNGSVTLAYLTDAAGGSGDFYLCDTSTAMMSDYVRFEGGDGRFLIVLDPGATAVPDGFTETALSVNGKAVRAWTYTGESSGSSSDDKDKKDEDKDEDKEEGEEDKKGGLLGIFGALKPIEVHALDIGVGAGAGEGGEETPAADVPAADTPDPGAVDTADNPDAQTADDGGADVASPVSATTQLDGSVGDPSEYFLIYGINQDGGKGFYLYDSLAQSYIRYVQMGGGDSDELDSAKKSARTRLFIIAGLAILLLVLVIILINMALSGRRGDTYDDDYDDYERVKRRVEKKTRSHTTKLRSRDTYDDDDYDDYGYDDYEDNDEPEDVKVYDKSSRKNNGFTAEVSNEVDWSDIGSLSAGEPEVPKKAPSQDIDLDDDFSFDFIKR